MVRRLLDLVGLTGLAVLAWMTYRALYGPYRLPDRVPTHFGPGGRPDGWGSPAGMVLLPAVAAGLYLLMSVVMRFPSAFHFPVASTALNRARLEAVTLDMIAWLKTELVCLFVVLQWAFIRAAESGNGHLFPRILPFFIVVIFATVGWHLFATVRAARPSGNG